MLKKILLGSITLLAGGVPCHAQGLSADGLTWGIYEPQMHFAEVFGRPLAIANADGSINTNPTLADAARALHNRTGTQAVNDILKSTAPGPLACQDMLRLSLPWVRIRSVAAMPTEGQIPAYCKVVGIIDKEITFEVDLPPTSAWNGKFLMGGSGGFLGNLQNGIKEAALNRGYASAVTDTGHPIPSDGGASWAYHDPLRVVNFGHRGTHLAAANAKLIIQAFYKERIEKSYFFGSSGSGRQAMMEAERYPEDFAGIVAACPAFSWTELNVFATGWTQQTMYPTEKSQYNFEPVVPPTKVAALDAAVCAKCDALDGLKDDVISNPLACKFDPVEDLPRCRQAEDNSSCFTLDQAVAIAKIHDGPSNSSGQIWPGWAYGGENIPGMWTSPMGRTADVIGNLKGSDPYSSRHYLLTNETLRYLVFNDPNYDLHKFNFETDVPSVALASAQVDANNPDLSAFKQAGGKLIISVGWSDWAVDGLGVKSFYDKIVQKMGGQDQVSDFARLFMLPGVGHCFTIDPKKKTPNTVGLLSTLENWEERNIIPDSIIASHIAIREGESTPAPAMSMPIEGSVDRTRPICAYPMTAVYKGSGSIDDAANFSCRLL